MELGIFFCIGVSIVVIFVLFVGVCAISAVMLSSQISREEEEQGR